MNFCFLWFLRFWHFHLGDWAAPVKSSSWLTIQQLTTHNWHSNVLAWGDGLSWAQLTFGFRSFLMVRWLYIWFNGVTEPFLSRFWDSQNLWSINLKLTCVSSCISFYPCIRQRWGCQGFSNSHGIKQKISIFGRTKSWCHRGDHLLE